MTKRAPDTGAGHTLVMGVVNATPDSFFGPSTVASPEAALSYGRAAKRDGVDILDVGGESSRPGADPVSPEVEIDRVIPVLETLRDLDIPLSIDTYHAETARRAVAAGATMVNDITALRGDSEMAGVIAESDAVCVLMHMQGMPRTMQEAPQYGDVVADLCAFFDERIEYAVSNGIPKERLWIDPGFGFGKTVEHNLTILRRLDEFRRFDLPILVGTSNKSTIGKVLGDLPVDERGEGTAATVAVAIWNGASAVRVHDVRAMSRVARMTDAIMGKGRHD